METLVLPVMSMGPEVQTPSPVVELLLTLNSLFSTENKVVDGLVVTVQLLVPASEVVPLASVKSSDHAVPVLVLLMVTVAVDALVHPFTGLVTVKLYAPVAVTTGFCAVDIKLFGPVQL